MTLSPNAIVAAVLTACAGTAFAATPDEGRFDSTCAIDGGRRLVVRASGNALSVRYGRRPTQTSWHDGQGVFASRDGTLPMRFALDAGGEPTTVRLNVPAHWP